MSKRTDRFLALGAVAMAAATVVAQSPIEPTTFAAPVRLHAGDKFLGQGRLFPSPVHHDIDGDGIADIVVGDLPGRLTVARGEKAEHTPSFGAESRLEAADGKQIDFHNW